jgi:outer membrane receptor protein involved in Fe transport
VDGQTSATANLTVGVGSEILSKWYVDPTNVISVAGYALMNARIVYRIRFSGLGLEATLAARNIFNKEYIAFTEPDPDGNSYQPAAQREVFTGFRITR